MLDMLRFSRKPYKLGLVLSGGGARGFAHAGALQALEEMGVKPDVIGGVSAGAVVTVMYASGMKPQEILKAFSDAKFGDFSELPLPAVVCATDLIGSKAVAFWEGSIDECVSASCSIPIVFKPVKIGGVMYVDGGVVANLPAWALRDKCKYLIGVNCSPMPRRSQPKSILDVAQLTYDLLVKNNSTEQMQMCDLAISINDIAKYKVFNLKEINRVFRSGYDSTMLALLNAGFVRPSDVKKT